MEENKKADKTSGNKEINTPHIEPINISELIKIEKSNSRKNMGNRDFLLVSYLNIIHNSITVHLGKKSKEMSKFLVALNHYLSEPPKQKYRLRPGDVIEVEFGLRYKGEVAFRHTAIVIQTLNNKTFVVPVTSNPEKIRQVKKTNPWYLKLLDQNDGFDHECVAVLNDASFIVHNRILSKIKGIHVDSEIISEFREELMNHMFSDEAMEYYRVISRLQAENDNLVRELQEKKNKLGRLYGKLNRLQRKSN